ncbi:MAG: YggS family pyridoxal phosphate-dependent enzyme [Woeseiaceae bacterium]|nr:YggS family pyridoxal phosphate-dependent enzyme [Woeseiaceae bacterium]
MIRVTENFRKIQDLLAQAAADAGRSREEIRLLAVSKEKPVECVLEAASAGQRDFGENFVREGLKKMDEAGRDDLIWHFIGHLQANKTKPVAERFHWVHTVDRLKIAERLSRQRPVYANDLNICIQVNIDEEAAKGGVPAAEVPQLAQAVSELRGLRLRGLMCIPAVRQGFEEQRKPFAKMRMLSESLRESGINTDTLSMGMTADYAAAIHEGATIVRIGTALFGARDSQRA